MMDLTELLQTAKQSTNWGQQRFTLLGEIASREAGGVWDWDEEAGEDWGRVIDAGGDVVMILWRRGPFAFVGRSAGTRLVRYLQSEGVFAGEPLDLDIRAFSLDPGEFSALFDREIPQSIDLATLSANEIWWASV